MIFAGTIADIDLVSALFGPASYFFARRTFTHSVIGTILIIAVAILLARYLQKAQPERIAVLIAPLSVVAVLHVLLDLLQSEGVAVLWPFAMKRYAADLLPSMDVWILVFLLAGILIPEVFRLVTSEIGAKDKAPRGRNGAIVALALIAVYIGARELLHNAAIGSLDPHSYKGESARHIGAFPDAFSIFSWHGVVETQSFLCLAVVPTAPGKVFDAESADCLNKPQPSPELQAAEQTELAHKYVNASPFPRATVARTQDGYEVIIRSMRDVAEHQTRHRVAARIQLDSHFNVTSEQLVWLDDIHLR